MGYEGENITENQETKRISGDHIHPCHLRKQHREKERDGMTWSVRVSYLISLTPRILSLFRLFFSLSPSLIWSTAIIPTHASSLVRHLFHLVHLDVDMIYTKKEIILYYNLNYPEYLYENQTQTFFF